MKSTFEKMGGTYTLGADGIYYPNLVNTVSNIRNVAEEIVLKELVYI